MKKILAALAGVLMLSGLMFTGPAMATPPAPNTNEVSYWCAHGIKLEPVSTPFVVPAPPDGWTWTLLVVKAGSSGHGGVVNENETFTDPVVGQSYTHSSGKDLSHVILCKTQNGTTTTAGSTTTAPPTTLATTTTVSDEETTTTTAASTTVQQTTTTGNVGICCLQEATTTTTTAATTTQAVTTVPPTTAAPVTSVDEPETSSTVVTAAPELPVTGSTSGVMVAVGVFLVLAGWACLGLRAALK